MKIEEFISKQYLLEWYVQIYISTFSDQILRLKYLFKVIVLNLSAQSVRLKVFIHSIETNQKAHAC